MAESIDQRLQDYQKRFQELMESAREGVERQAPEVLDKLATTARNIAQRFEDLASDARQREAEKEAAPESAGTSEPMPPEGRKPDPPPAPRPDP
jgi:hypothetical protein